MEKLTAQGIIISKVECQHERLKAAQLLDKPLEEVPLKFGSLRMAVNLISINNEVFNVSKKPLVDYLKEERFIIEVSYKFDYKNNPSKVIAEHEVVNKINVGDAIEMNMEHAYISKNHVMKVINFEPGKTIRSLFLKTWADNISLNPLTLQTSTQFIRPYELLKWAVPTVSLAIV